LPINLLSINFYQIVIKMRIVIILFFLQCNTLTSTHKISNNTQNKSSLSIDNELLTILSCEQKKWYGGVKGIQSATYNLKIKLKYDSKLYSFDSITIDATTIPIMSREIENSVAIIQAKISINEMESPEFNGNENITQPMIKEKADSKNLLYFTFKNDKHKVEITEITVLQPDVSY